MSVMNPMRITSSEMAATAGWASSSPAVVRAALIVASFMGCLLVVLSGVSGLAGGKGSDPEQGVECLVLVGELAGREALDHLAVLHDVEMVGQGSGEVEILLHHDDGVAFGLQGGDHAGQRLH